MTPTITPEAARLAEELRRYADLIEDEMVDEPKRCVGDAGDCAAPVMRQAADALSALAKQDAAPTSASTVPAGFWLAPMEMNASMHGAAVQAHASFGIKYSDKPERIWVAVRDSYLARNPGACSVTDGEAKK